MEPELGPERYIWQMDRIALENVVPAVFARNGNLVSDVWRQNVTFEKGRTYLVEAASGTGKSTMCSYIIGYRHDYSGRILFDDEDIRSFGDARWSHIRQRNISLLFQELRLFPELTAWENIAIKNQLTKHKSDADIMEWFERLGIGDKVDSRLGLMSYGQQQRVAMIRALVQPFDFIVVDEPISHLDEENSRIMADIMHEEAMEQGAGVIVTSSGKHMSNRKYDGIIKL